jgi:hypothetical protein
VLTNQSVQVSGLPDDGRQLWVRLSTRLNGLWEFDDYSFTAMTTASVSINDVTVTEGNTGTSTATFTVTLAPANPSQSVTVAFATANQTATTANSDYVAGSGTLTFGAGVTTRTISVTINGDQVVESNETFLVNLSNPTNAVIGDAQGVGTITNDDVPACTTCPAVTVGSTTVNPGATITFQLSNGPGNPIDWVGFYAAGAEDRGNYLQWQHLNGSTSPPSSGIRNATLQFTAPQTPGAYNIRWFANGGYTSLATSATITVGAPSPALTINNVSVTEGSSGSANATFTVTISPVNASQTVTVGYATANGTATAGSDYTAVSGTLTFAPSVGTQTITVPVFGDVTDEPNETFVVNLSNATNAVIGDAQGVGTITNDDMPACTTCPAVTVGSTTVNPGATINFQISNGPGSPIDWVAFHAAGADDRIYSQWQFLSGTQSPPALGRTSAALQFTAPQTPGTYNIRFYASGGYTKLATGPTITIAAPQPTLTINDVSTAEGNGGTANVTFTVTISPVNSSQSVTVNYATANGTATTASSDYSAVSGTLTFAPSVATQTITVPVVGDATDEPHETFVVNLSNATNAVIGDAQGVGTITNDDMSACTTCPAVTLASTTVNPGATINFQISNGPGSPIDWVAFHAAGADDRIYQQWQFLSGSQSLPSPGRTSATLAFTAPQTPGTYNIRFFHNGGYTKLATSATILVVP